MVAITRAAAAVVGWEGSLPQKNMRWWQPPWGMKRSVLWLSLEMAGRTENHPFPPCPQMDGAGVEARQPVASLPPEAPQASGGKGVMVGPVVLAPESQDISTTSDEVVVVELSSPPRKATPSVIERVHRVQKNKRLPILVVGDNMVKNTRRRVTMRREKSVLKSLSGKDCPGLSRRLRQV
ncbi:uncharacterized protein LOC135090903 isoform X2 [Scylla paramamosain]|uniref:uncharacterized protein LOC135090903 isoform X2 n=1 Tax=Scylla paramamosain TaxID=85552 RepID=UPI003082DAA4